MRYANDCNIYVKNQWAGEQVMRSITRFLEKRLKVKVNLDKTKVGSPLRLKFFGFLLGVDRSNGQAIKLLTKSNRGVSLIKMFKEIHQKMYGWLQYYSIGKLANFIHCLVKSANKAMHLEAMEEIQN